MCERSAVCCIPSLRLPSLALHACGYDCYVSQGACSATAFAPATPESHQSSHLPIACISLPLCTLCTTCRSSPRHWTRRRGWRRRRRDELRSSRSPCPLRLQTRGAKVDGGNPPTGTALHAALSVCPSATPPACLFAQPMCPVLCSSSLGQSTCCGRRKHDSLPSSMLLALL